MCLHWFTGKHKSRWWCQMSVQKSSNLLDGRSCAKEDRPIVHSLPPTDDYKNWTKVIFRSHNLFIGQHIYQIC